MHSVRVRVERTTDILPIQAVAMARKHILLMGIIFTARRLWHSGIYCTILQLKTAFHEQEIAQMLCKTGVLGASGCPKTRFLGK
jgi:hypothetical protein